MKRRSVLDKQSIRRKETRKPGSGLFEAVKKTFGLFFKLGVLFSAVAVVSVIFLYLYQYLVSSPYLKLEQVSITGADRELKKELMMISELDSDQSLLTIDIDEIKAKMETHPWIRSADIEKRFPDTLLVVVEKEVPTAVVSMDKLFYMNRWGMLFKEVEHTDNKDYPVVTGIEKNGKAAESLHFASRILEVLKTAGGAWSLNELSEIHFNSDNSVYLYSTSLTAVIKIGSNELALKSDDLKKVVDHLTRTGRIHMVKSIDLNYGNGAVVSFRKSG